MTRSERPRPASVAVAAIWALVALVLLVGVPVALARLVGNPLPTTVPSREDLTLALTRGQIDAWTWVKAATLVAWTAWADLVASFVVELVAAARGRSAGRRRALAPTRWLAAKVVGKWALLASLAVHTGPPVSRAVLPAVTAPLVARSPVPGGVAGGGAASMASSEAGEAGPAAAPAPPPERAPAAPGETEVTVARRDTLWQLARTHLGDGSCWEVIRDANVGRRMPDGTVLRAGFTRLEPGWRLLVPGEPVVPAAGPEGAGARTDDEAVTVRRGDTLWGLSRQHLQPAGGTAGGRPTDRAVARYVEQVVAANQPAVADPDLIHPGQVLRFPSTAPGTPAADPDTGDPDAGQASDPGVAPPAGHETEEVPVLAADSAFAAEEGWTEAGVEAAPAEGGEASGALAPAGGIPVPANQIPLGVAGGLLAAGALGVVRRRRRYRLAHRRPRTVPTGPGRHLEGIERALNAQQDPETEAWLQAAMASLATRPVWAGEPVAQPVLARLGADQLEVTFSHPDPMAAPLPWITADEGLTWTLDRRLAPADLPSGDGRPAAPTLVTVGAGLLLNLEGVGHLGISGPGSMPADLARSLIHELATRTGAGPVDLRTTYPVEGTGSFPLVRTARPADLVGELVPWIDDARHRLAATGAGNAYAFRLQAQAQAEPLTPVVIVADDRSWPGLGPLVDHAAQADLPLALIGVGVELEPGRGHQIQLAGRRATITPGSVTAEAQLLSSQAATELGELLADAAGGPEGRSPDEPLLPGLRLSASVTELRRRAEPDGERPEATPVEPPVEVAVTANPEPEPEAEPQPEPEAEPGPDREPEPEEVAELEVRVLGAVEIEGLDAELTSQQLSLLCYLACNGPSTRASLIDALWDGQVISQSRFPNLLAEVRARVGRHHFPEARDGRYELVGVTTDLARLERAVSQANRQDTATAVETLRAALAPVRGVPLTVPSTRFWTWVGDQTHFSARVEALVADTAAQLARLEQGRNNLDGAVWACEQGLKASPTDETLVTILTETYVRQGKEGPARRLVEGWEERISRLDCGEPSDEPRKRLAG